jgi:hypothetical protein
MTKILNEGNQINNFILCVCDTILLPYGSGTVINYGSCSGSNFFTSYSYSSGSTRKKATVPTVPVPVPQHCLK